MAQAYTNEDGSTGTYNEDGSGSYTGADGSTSTWDADGNGSYEGADGSSGSLVGNSFVAVPEIAFDEIFFFRLDGGGAI